MRGLVCGVWVRVWVCRDGELGMTPVMDWEGSWEEDPSLYMADPNYPHGPWDAINSPLLAPFPTHSVSA